MAKESGQPHQKLPPLPPTNDGRLKRLETVRAVEESSHSLKIEFAYLKLLPCEHEGPRHIASVSQRPDRRCE
jgi:hypothetical protein